MNIRRKPSPIDKPAEPWRRELHLFERNRANEQERASEATKRREDARARWTSLLAAAAADMELVRELGTKTHGISPTWARDLSARLQGRIASIIRLLDEDTDGILQIEEMSVPVRQAVERVLAQRARIQVELLDD